MRQFSMAHLTALTCSAPELVSLAAEAGFDGVGLRLGPARRNEVLADMTVGSSAYRDTQRRLNDLGITLHDVEVLILYPETQRTDFIGLFEATAGLGAQHIVVNSEDPDEMRATDHFAEQCAEAAEFGLTLGLEFMRYRELKSLAQASRMMDAVDTGNARLLIDTLHFFRAGQTVAEAGAISPTQISFVQLCDGPLADPPLDLLQDEARYARMVPGEGGLPLVDLLAELPPDIPISVEVPTRDFRPILDHAKAILAGARLVCEMADRAREQPKH